MCTAAAVQWDADGTIKLAHPPRVACSVAVLAACPNFKVWHYYGLFSAQG